MRKYQQETKSNLQESQKYYDEPSFRKELLNAYDDIKTAFTKIQQKNAINKLIKQIKL